MTIRTTRLANPLTALGAALRFVAARNPFAAFPAQALVATVQGEIDRGHYLFGVDGQRIRAYLGWAMLDAGVAERLARTGVAPTAAEACGGDVIWLLTVVAEDTAALNACLDAGRRFHAGRRIMAVRRRTNGHVRVIDHVIRPPGGDSPFDP